MLLPPSVRLSGHLQPSDRAWDMHVDTARPVPHRCNFAQPQCPPPTLQGAHAPKARTACLHRPPHAPCASK